LSALAHYKAFKLEKTKDIIILLTLNILISGCLHSAGDVTKSWRSWKPLQDAPGVEVRVGTKSTYDGYCSSCGSMKVNGVDQIYSYQNRMDNEIFGIRNVTENTIEVMCTEHAKKGEITAWKLTKILPGARETKTIDCQGLPQALTTFTKIAQLGVKGSQYHLARAYYDGSGISKNYTQAIAWAQKAAAQNDSNAQDLIGLAYLHGNGVKKDYRLAALWLQKAASNGHKGALFNLGKTYAGGMGVARDFNQAATYYRQAGTNYSIMELGSLYLEGGYGIKKKY
jgi:TPR repeat protein